MSPNVAATGAMPAALIFSLLAANSAHVVGTDRPRSAYTFLLYRMPPPIAVSLGAPKILSPAETVGRYDSSMLAIQGSPETSTSDSAGLSACSSEPELYQKMSVISPVESRVLTMLSPSVPPSRVSISKVTFGCRAV